MTKNKIITVKDLKELLLDKDEDMLVLIPAYEADWVGVELDEVYVEPVADFSNPPERDFYGDKVIVAASNKNALFLGTPRWDRFYKLTQEQLTND